MNSRVHVGCLAWHDGKAKCGWLVLGIDTIRIAELI